MLIIFTKVNETPIYDMIMLAESDHSKHNSIRNLQLTENHEKTEIVVSLKRLMIEKNW